MSDHLADAAGMEKRDRPRGDGLILGEAIATMADAGRVIQPDLPDICATCAFRRGTMTNMMPATVLTAFNCATGVDQSDFGCHHGMAEGVTRKACVGWLAAQAADWPDVKRIMSDLGERLNAFDESRDLVRAEFDEWISRVDPDGRLDDYQRGRLWLRRSEPPRSAGRG